MRKKHQFSKFCIVLLFGLLINHPQISLLAEEDGLANIYLPTLLNSYVPAVEQSLFGLQMYGDTGQTSPYHPYLIGSKANWLRVNLSWQAVEPTNVDPESYNWSSLDRNLSGALPENGGLKVIANVENNPVWAADLLQGPIDLEDVPEFAQFMGAAVERYDGDGVDDAPGSPIVLHWEIYNEPDRNGDRWGGEGARYADMLGVIYPAIKSANPSAKVLLGGLAYDWFEEDGGPFERKFLEDVFANGGAQYLDMINFHAYPTFSLNWTGQTNTTGVIAKTNAIRDLMAQYNVDLPVIITESGFHDNDAVGASSTPELQSRYLVTLFTEAIAADIDIMIWWLLYDIGDFYPYNNGLVTNSANPVQTKQSYAIYQNLVEQFEAAEFIKSLSPSETGNSDASVHQFTNLKDQSTVYVAWRTVVTSDEYISVNIPVNSAIIRDTVENTTVVVNDGDDGINDNQITIQVNGRPQIIESNQ